MSELECFRNGTGARTQPGSINPLQTPAPLHVVTPTMGSGAQISTSALAHQPKQMQQ